MNNRKISVAYAFAIGMVAALVLVGTAGAETGLVGEWHFDGDAQDSSGNGNHGTVYGATFVEGISGQALSFDGSNDYVSVPDAPSFTVSEVTVEAWIKPDNTVFQGIVTNHANGVDADGSWVLYKSDKVCFIIFTNTGEQLPACGGSISASSWYHIVGTWSSSSGSKIYLNGVNVGTVTTSGTLPDPINPVEIGRYHVYNPPNQYWFDGIIDEVRIYNRSLSAEEIKAHYDLGIAVPATVDIKPDTLNMASKSNKNAVTAYIEIPGYDVNEIDVSTVTMSTKKGEVSAQLSPTGVGDYDNDGIPDRMVKFDRQAVIAIVDVGEANITIRGSVEGVTFEGNDIISVVG